MLALFIPAGDHTLPPAGKSTAPQNYFMFAACKSPLSYPGGKTRAVDTLTAHLPAGIATLASPFLGGASFEIAAAAAGIRVHGYDGYLPTANFWRYLLADAPAVAAIARRYFHGDRTIIKSLVDQYDGLPSDVERAAAMYVISRCGYAARVMSDWIDPHRHVFKLSHIDRQLATFSAPLLSVAHADFADSIAAHPDDFLYLDPPYDVASGLYGKAGSHHDHFDHQLLAKLLTGRQRWMLSYNDCPRVRLLYEGHRYTALKWRYTMSAHRDGSELLIFSSDLELPADYPTLTWST